MELIVKIDQGQIVVANARNGQGETYKDEREAAARIAYKVVQKASLFSLDASCDRPSAHGRPWFSKGAFQGLLAREIGSLRGSVSALAI